MSKEYQQILEQALALPQKEFYALAQAILAKIQQDMAGKTERLPWETDELFQELDRRVEEVRSGKVQAISDKTVMSKLKKRFA